MGGCRATDGPQESTGKTPGEDWEDLGGVFNATTRPQESTGRTLRGTGRTLGAFNVTTHPQCDQGLGEP